MTAIDFISSVGGLFGLCLGFSLISFFELIYWFLVQSGRRWRTSRTPGQRRTREARTAEARKAESLTVTDIDGYEAEHKRSNQPGISDSNLIIDSSDITDDRKITDDSQITDDKQITDDSKITDST